MLPSPANHDTESEHSAYAELVEKETEEMNAFAEAVFQKDDEIAQLKAQHEAALRQKDAEIAAFATKHREMIEQKDERISKLEYVLDHKDGIIASLREELAKIDAKKLKNRLTIKKNNTKSLTKKDPRGQGRTRAKLKDEVVTEPKTSSNKSPDEEVCFQDADGIGSGDSTDGPLFLNDNKSSSSEVEQLTPTLDEVFKIDHEEEQEQEQDGSSHDTDSRIEVTQAESRLRDLLAESAQLLGDSESFSYDE